MVTGKENIVIPVNAKIRVYWDDSVDNYTKENKAIILNHYSNKYNIDKKNINVVFRPIKVDTNGEIIQVSGADIDNIMDVTYQRQLFNEWLERENRVVDMTQLLKLDDKVNGLVTIKDNNTKHRKYNLKKLYINNFLSYGDDNAVNFEKLNGLTIVTSSPANFGGKTTFSVDSIKFLFFGTTTKTDKNEDIFNLYTDKNEVIVRGLMEIDGELSVIQRKLTRKAQKNGDWTVKNEVKYFEVLSNGEERELIESKQGLEEEDGKKTTKKIIETIGTEKDFETTILATAKNLEDLIESKPTERGKLFTRFIGLEVIEEKETIVRKLHGEFSKKMKSNIYNIADLETENDAHKTNIENNDNLLVTYDNQLGVVKNTLDELNNKKEELLGGKIQIDSTITSMNPEKLLQEIEVIKADGLKLKTKIEEADVKIAEIGVVTFDEDNHNQATKELNEDTAQKRSSEIEIGKLIKWISDLEKSGICPTCKRKLEDIDHTQEITDNKNKIIVLEADVKLYNENITKLNEELEGLNKIKKLIDTKNSIELQKEKAQVEIDSLRNKIKSKQLDLKSYESNVESIKKNREIDIEISLLNTKITVANTERDTILRTIEKTKGDTETNKTKISEKLALIETIKKEDEIDKIFKLYTEIVGKKGISKLVLRSVLPLINSELHRLLEDTTDFEVELSMNEKNEVEFSLIRDGVSNYLKAGSGFEKTAASLALRCVLTRVSNLPKPNFIVFDEVLGKVAAENYDNMKIVFDKIKDMYDTVFLISHIDTIKDWSENIITIKKENNISKINMN
jgi:DNA repair exonuclease SbcCD ATPase subunit